jgi:DNA-binding response OmpR family regulator
MASSLPDLTGFTILVIEDDTDNLEVLTTALTTCGARVLTATDTTIARSHIDRVKLDLVITDLGLPGESGAAFLSWLRTQPRDHGGSLAAVAVTGYPEEFPALSVGGFAAYFQKPLDIDDICATVNAILRRAANSARRPGDDERS